MPAQTKKIRKILPIRYNELENDFFFTCISISNFKSSFPFPRLGISRKEMNLQNLKQLSDMMISLKVS